MQLMKINRHRRIRSCLQPFIRYIVCLEEFPDFFRSVLTKVRCAPFIKLLN